MNAGNFLRKIMLQVYGKRERPQMIFIIPNENNVLFTQLYRIRTLTADLYLIYFTGLVVIQDQCSVAHLESIPVCIFQFGITQQIKEVAAACPHQGRT